MSKTSKKKTNLIVVTSILCLTGLEIIAIYHGINGIAFTSVVAAIAGLGGWSLPQPKFLSKRI